MKTGIVLVVLALLLGCTAKKEVKPYNKGINIVPQPNELVKKEGVFTINNSTLFVIPDAVQFHGIAELTNMKFKRAAGFELAIAHEKPAINYIAAETDPTCGMGEEGYCLQVTPEGATVKGTTDRGIFYGIQTLLQLLPAEIESPQLVTNVNWTIPCVEIRDEPRFKWRGMHLDVCRHFFSVDFIKKQLDVLAMYKINTFHWHLTEDQGWRIEIKKYPKLTEIGSKRMEGEGYEYGGFYTQEQIKEVVQYARERYINIVPEIELPGHALAALTAYPEYSCTGGPFRVRNIWGVEADVYCAGKDGTFQFLEDIIDEVTQLFPYEYFHIGGDECPKKRWEKCPDCQRRIRKEGLKDEHELQSYFVKRVEKMLIARGKKMVGWDEILEGGLAPSATVMSWRGEQGGIEAAGQGHDVVMTPGNWVYLDHYQGSSKVEPTAIGGYTTLQESYEYEPVPAGLEEGKHHHVLGTQGNVWSEYMYTPEICEYRAYSRIIALAEVNWTPKEKKDIDSFLKRINNQYVRLDMHGINYHIPLPEGPANHVAFTDTATLEFTTTRRVKMVYTTDGSEPGEHAAVYSQPLKFTEDAMVKICTILPSGKKSAVRTIKVEKQQLTEAENVETTGWGLNMKMTMGHFVKVADLENVTQWETSVVAMDELSGMFDYQKPSAAIFTGYINIPEDGVYLFSTDVDQFFIGGKLLIDNDGEVKRFSRNDASVALAKGYHAIKIVFLNNITGGWPQAWNRSGVQLKKAGEEEFEPVVFEI